MCGIVGFTGTQPAAPILLEGLKRLEYRGYDSAGIAVQDGGAISVAKTRGVIKNLCEKTKDGTTMSGISGIGHTRWATHGVPDDVNAHPHVSNDGMFAVVHNGIIENFAVLKSELEKKGYKFESQTDTEIVANLLDLYYKGDLLEAVLKTVSRLDGSYSLGVLCAEHPGKIVAVREKSPLILGIGVGENYFASDVTALVSHTRNVIYLDDGEVAVLTPDSIDVFNSAGRRVEKSTSRVIWDIEAAEKGGYEHFMLKEIMEQPRAIMSTLEPRIKNGRIILDDIPDAYFDGVEKIIITACGSAYYAGCVGRYVIEKLCRIPVTVELASELRYHDPIIDEHTLLIVISQSGETADTIAALRECKERGAKSIAICNVVGSTIARTAEHCIYTWAGPEIAVATTKGYTTQVAVLGLFAVYTAEKLGRISAERYSALIGELLKLPSKVQRAVDLNSHISYLAKRYAKHRDVFFIGRNIDYAVALEGSLKLKEISYIFSEPYAAGELKHGPIALIEQDTLVVTLCCYDELFDKTLSNIEQVKARGATVLAVAHEGNGKIFHVADDAVFVPESEPLFAAVPEIIPLQLFAYYIAKENGCDIDKPKNLAKSVTVE